MSSDSVVCQISRIEAPCRPRFDKIHKMIKAGLWDLKDALVSDDKVKAKGIIKRLEELIGVLGECEI